MLAQEVVRKYGTRARFAVEDLGASAVAQRFGIDKYPAIFVDEALVARPEDFYAWGGPETGRYLPWKEVSSRRRFQADLQRMIDIRLAGGELQSLQAVKSQGPRTLPAVDLVDLSGKKFRFDDLRGKPTIIEFWATWCPPCLDTLQQMKNWDTTRVNVVAIAIESDRKHVDSVIAKLTPPARFVMGTESIRDAFDGPPAVPTMLLADADGKIVRTFYGAPKTLHADIESEIARLTKN